MAKRPESGAPSAGKNKRSPVLIRQLSEMIPEQHGYDSFFVGATTPEEVLTNYKRHIGTLRRKGKLVDDQVPEGLIVRIAATFPVTPLEKARFDAQNGLHRGRSDVAAAVVRAATPPEEAGQDGVGEDFKERFDQMAESTYQQLLSKLDEVPEEHRELIARHLENYRTLAPALSESLVRLAGEGFTPEHARDVLEKMLNFVQTRLVLGNLTDCKVPEFVSMVRAFNAALPAGLAGTLQTLSLFMIIASVKNLLAGLPISDLKVAERYLFGKENLHLENLPLLEFLGRYGGPELAPFVSKALFYNKHFDGAGVEGEGNNERARMRARRVDPHELFSELNNSRLPLVRELLAQLDLGQPLSLNRPFELYCAMWMTPMPAGTDRTQVRAGGEAEGGGADTGAAPRFGMLRDIFEADCIRSKGVIAGDQLDALGSLFYSSALLRVKSDPEADVDSLYKDSVRRFLETLEGDDSRASGALGELLIDPGRIRRAAERAESNERYATYVNRFNHTLRSINGLGRELIPPENLGMRNELMNLRDESIPEVKRNDYARASVGELLLDLYRCLISDKKPSPVDYEKYHELLDYVVTTAEELINSNPHTLLGLFENGLKKGRLNVSVIRIREQLKQLVHDREHAYELFRTVLKRVKPAGITLEHDTPHEPVISRADLPIQVARYIIPMLAETIAEDPDSPSSDCDLLIDEIHRGDYETHYPAAFMLISDLFRTMQLERGSFVDRLRYVVKRLCGSPEQLCSPVVVEALVSMVEAVTNGIPYRVIREMPGRERFSPQKANEILQSDLRDISTNFQATVATQIMSLNLSEEAVGRLVGLFHGRTDIIPLIQQQVEEKHKEELRRHAAYARKRIEEEKLTAAYAGLELLKRMSDSSGDDIEESLAPLAKVLQTKIPGVSVDFEALIRSLHQTHTIPEVSDSKVTLSATAKGETEGVQIDVDIRRLRASGEMTAVIQLPGGIPLYCALGADGRMVVRIILGTAERERLDRSQCLKRGVAPHVFDFYNELLIRIVKTYALPREAISSLAEGSGNGSSSEAAGSSDAGSSEGSGPADGSLSAEALAEPETRKLPQAFDSLRALTGLSPVPWSEIRTRAEQIREGRTIMLRPTDRGVPVGPLRDVEVSSRIRTILVRGKPAVRKPGEPLVDHARLQSVVTVTLNDGAQLEVHLGDHGHILNLVALGDSPVELRRSQAERLGIEPAVFDQLNRLALEVLHYGSVGRAPAVKADNTPPPPPADPEELGDAVDEAVPVDEPDSPDSPGSEEIEPSAPAQLAPPTLSGSVVINVDGEGRSGSAGELSEAEELAIRQRNAALAVEVFGPIFETSDMDTLLASLPARLGELELYRADGEGFVFVDDPAELYLQVLTEQVGLDEVFVCMARPHVVPLTYAHSLRPYSKHDENGDSLGEPGMEALENPLAAFDGPSPLDLPTDDLAHAEDQQPRYVRLTPKRPTAEAHGAYQAYLRCGGDPLSLEPAPGNLVVRQQGVAGGDLHRLLAKIADPRWMEKFITTQLQILIDEEADSLLSGSPDDEVATCLEPFDEVERRWRSVCGEASARLQGLPSSPSVANEPLACLVARLASDDVGVVPTTPEAHLEDIMSSEYSEAVALAPAEGCSVSFITDEELARGAYTQGGEVLSGKGDPELVTLSAPVPVEVIHRTFNRGSFVTVEELIVEDASGRSGRNGGSEVAK